MQQTIEVEINGQKLPVRYDANALTEFESLTGKSYFDAIQKVTITNQRALAYVGLKCGHLFATNKTLPFEKNIDQVGEWIPINKLKEFLPIALKFTIGEVDDKDKPESQPGE